MLDSPAGYPPDARPVLPPAGARGRPGAVTPLLAVYGTLRRGYRNHPLIEDGSAHLGTGWLPGRLVTVASVHRPYPYPAYVPDDPGAARRVVVEVVGIMEETLWPALDALERYMPDDLPGSEYRRVLARAEMADGGRLACWTYVYNDPVTGFTDVPDGDWAAVHPPEPINP